MKSSKTLLAAVALLSFQCAVFSAGVVGVADEAALQTALIGGGIVTFDCDGVIVLSNTMVIATDTVLDGSGHGVTISGNGATRIFTVNANVNFVVKNLTLANGLALVAGGDGTGGALCNFGAVQIIQCVFSNNIASGTNDLPYWPSAGSGGAIFNMGILFVGDAVFIKNRAVGTNLVNGIYNQGAGSTGSGGAIYNGGMLSVSNTLFFGNSATGGDGYPNFGPTWAGDSYGGAIYNSGSASIFNCTFSSNNASGGRGGDGVRTGTQYGGSGGVASGGGICNSALLSIFNTTFTGNKINGGDGGQGGPGGQGAPGYPPPPGGPGGQGGDASGGGFDSFGGTAILVNITFYDNSATSGRGGHGGNGADGIGDYAPGGNGGNGGGGGNGIAGGICNIGGTINVTNVTCVANVSSGGVGGTGGAAGAPAFRVPGGNPGLNGTNGNSEGQNIAAINGSLVLKNTIVSGSSPSANAYGIIIDGGYNLSSDASCDFTNWGSGNDINPLLGPLANNGGLTETCALLSGSPAIDAITDGSYPVTDQRGFSRPFGSAGDIGAVEYYSGAFIIHSLTPNNNKWQIAGIGFPSTAYRLQASTDLKNWFTVETNVTSNDGSFKSVDATSTNSASQFYRISVP